MREALAQRERLRYLRAAATKEHVYRLVVLITGLAVAPPAWAQTLQVFHPAPGRGNFLSAHGSAIPTHRSWTAGLVLDFADDLLVGANGAKLVDSRLTTHAMGTFGLWNRFEIGLVVPFALLQHGIDAYQGASLGDIRLVPKARLLWRGAASRGFRLALIPELSFPSGDEEKRNGEPGVTAAPRVALDGVLFRWRGALNLGYRIRESSGGGPGEQDDEVILAAALSRELPRGFEVLVEAYGHLGAAVDEGFSEVAAPFEVLLAARYVKLPWGLVASLGGGAGITRGTGASDVRILAALSYQRSPRVPLPARTKKIAPKKDIPKKPPAKKPEPPKPEPEEEEPNEWELE